MIPEVQVSARVVTLPLTTETDLLCDSMAAPDTKGIDVTNLSRVGMLLKNSHASRNIASIAVYRCYEPTGTRWTAADVNVALAAALTPAGLVDFSFPTLGCRRLRITATSAAGGSEATLDCFIGGQS